MGVLEINSNSLPKLSKNIKSSINLGTLNLYKIDGEFPYGVFVGDKVYLLQKNGRVVKVIDNTNHLIINDKIYFSDLPRSESMFNFAIS